MHARACASDQACIWHAAHTFKTVSHAFIPTPSTQMGAPKPLCVPHMPEDMLFQILATAMLVVITEPNWPDCHRAQNLGLTSKVAAAAFRNVVATHIIETGVPVYTGKR